MRLLIFGHTSHTGFGIVTEAIGSRLIKAGIDVRIIAVNHRGEPVKGPLEGRVWPAGFYGDPFGGSFSGAAIDGSFWQQLDSDDQWRPDAVLVVADMTGFANHMGQKNLNLLIAGGESPWTQVPVFHYCPIEGDNLDPSWKRVWDRMNPVAMSRFGAGEISGLIGRPVPMVYHGVDTDVFRPVSMSDPVHFDGKTIRTREDAKRALGLDPNRLLVLRSDRLVTRKFYDRMLTAMGLVFDQVPDVDLLIHCRAIDEGLSIHDEVARMRPEHAQRILLTNAHDTWRGLPTEGMVTLMNAADLYVSTTGGEGFGLNLAESLACGVPVVVTDWAADREVVGDGGVLIPPLHDSYGETVRFHSQYGMDWAVPDPRAFTAPIVNLLTHHARRRSLGATGRLHVKRSFSWDEAAASFQALFEDTDATARLAS